MHYYPRGFTNYSNINDPKLNQLIEAQRGELDPDKRQEILMRSRDT